MAHGPLMVCGFLGMLIPLERAVAILQLDLGARLSGMGLLALGLWFLPNDIARRNLNFSCY